MRYLLTAFAVLLGACASDPTAYSAGCTRFHVPASATVGDKLAGTARPGSVSREGYFGGPLPRVVSTDIDVEVNCDKPLYRTEEPVDTSGEPQPL